MTPQSTIISYTQDATGLAAKRVDKVLRLEWVHVDLSSSGAGFFARVAILPGLGDGWTDSAFTWSISDGNRHSYDLTWPKGQGPVVRVAQVLGNLAGVGGTASIRIVGEVIE